MVYLGDTFIFFLHILIYLFVFNESDVKSSIKHPPPLLLFFKDTTPNTYLIYHLKKDPHFPTLNKPPEGLIVLLCTVINTVRGRPLEKCWEGRGNHTRENAKKKLCKGEGKENIMQKERSY